MDSARELILISREMAIPTQPSATTSVDSGPDSGTALLAPEYPVVHSSNTEYSLLDSHGIHAYVASRCLELVPLQYCELEGHFAYRAFTWI